MVGELRVAEVNVVRDILGRLESTEWTIFGEKRPIEKRTYNIDGQVIIFSPKSPSLIFD